MPDDPKGLWRLPLAERRAILAKQRDTVEPMTDADTSRVEVLEARDGDRTTKENDELQDLYLHRWLYRNIQRGLAVVVKPVVQAWTGRASWGKRD